jgi:hypothetical protein
VKSYLPYTLESNYLHYEFDVGPNDTIQVTLDKPANVKLLDDTNYQKYREGQQYRYDGGFTKALLVILTVPHEGHWHLVIDLGGYPGTVQASTAVTKG